MFLFGRRRQEEAPWWINTLLQYMDLVLKNQETIMSQMDDLRAAVARNRDAEQSVVTMLQGISQQLKDAKAQNDPAAVQEVINQLDANTAAMAKAVTDNTLADTGGAPQNAPGNATQPATSTDNSSPPAPDSNR